MYAIHHLSQELFVFSTAMESDTNPTASLILPVLFNFSKRLESNENVQVAKKAEELCKMHLSSVDRVQVQTFVDEILKIFKKTFLHSKTSIWTKAITIRLL